MAKFIISLAIIFSCSIGYSNPWATTQAVATNQQAVQSVSQANPSAVPQQKGFFESSTFERTADKIFDTDKDSFDFENGSLNWKGKTFNVGDSRMVRARFERYLAHCLSVIRLSV